MMILKCSQTTESKHFKLYHVHMYPDDEFDNKKGHLVDF